MAIGMRRSSLGYFALASFAGLACGTSTAADPFADADAGVFFADAGLGGAGGGASTTTAGGGGGEGGGGADGGAPVDPTLGGPCADDPGCDDGVACTTDRCDAALGRCRFTPDDSSCQNGLVCDGVERCDGKLGCVPGTPETCDDGSACTIDACAEPTKTCSHVARDVDGDGDPDEHCLGADCDDQDPSVSSKHEEVCANGRDDDCDGEVDEAPCASPSHDTCLDPLEIAQSGSYAMSTVAAHLEYPSDCKVSQSPATARDVVAAVELPPGPPVDVEVTARAFSSDVAVALGVTCGDAASVLTCGGPFFSPQGGFLAKLRARGLGDAQKPTAYPLYVTTSLGADVTLDVLVAPAAPAPTNETCGTAAELAPGVPAVVDLVGAATDLGGACQPPSGDLVYHFALDAAYDVTLYATSTDGDGNPSISLRGSGCTMPSDELACVLGNAQQGATLFRKGLPNGDYFVAVSASAPTVASLTLELAPATPPASDETCQGAPALAPNTTIDVSLAGHQDDVSLGCLPGAVDAAYALAIPATSDVLLVERIGNGDVGSIALADPACTPPGLLFCATGAPSPVRAHKHGVAAGDYRVVVETTQGQPTKATAFVRPAAVPVLVPFADACADVVDIPETGGIFQGNTANASADFSAGCDQGGQPKGGAPEQLLRLVIPQKRRVVFDMSGSSFDTLLDVRKGPACPGKEVLSGCAVGYPPSRSYLDLTLDAGTYFVQVDGFNGASGAWFLDVYVADP